MIPSSSVRIKRNFDGAAGVARRGVEITPGRPGRKSVRECRDPPNKLVIVAAGYAVVTHLKRQRGPPMSSGWHDRHRWRAPKNTFG
jgi:hypothetical protein